MFVVDVDEGAEPAVVGAAVLWVFVVMVVVVGDEESCDELKAPPTPPPTAAPTTIAVMDAINRPNARGPKPQGFLRSVASCVVCKLLPDCL